MTKKQKYELTKLVAEAGLEPSRFEWVSPSRLPSSWSSIVHDTHSQCFQDRVTKNAFAFGPLRGPNTARKLTIFPHRLSLCTRTSAANWEVATKFFSDWVEQVREDEREAIDWPTSSEVETAREHLSLEVINLVGSVLRKVNLRLENFKWSRSGSGAVLRSLAESSLSLSVSDKLSSNFTGSLAPADDRSHRPFETSGRDGLTKIVSEWANAVKDHLQVPSQPPSFEEQPSTPFRITRLELKNIRGFRDFVWTDIGNHKAPQSSLVVVGTNGTGKSTLLRSIVLTLLPEAQAAHLLGYPVCRLISNESTQGSVCIEVRFSDGQTCQFRSEFIRTKDGSETVEPKSNPKDLERVRVYAYGSGRATDGTVNADGSPKRRAVLSLFDYKTPLVDPDTLLLRLKRHEIDDICKRFSLVMGLDEPSNIEVRDRGEIWIQENDREFPLKNWADGYRLTFQWYLDLWYSCLQFERGNMKVETQPFGLLLVDELALHLHPSLQSSLLNHFSQAFPNLFGVFTTHSPLITLGLPANRLIVLRKEGDTVVGSTASDTRNYTVEDALRDPNLFDTSPYSAQKTEDLAAWRGMMKKSPHEMTSEERSRFADLTQRVMNQ